MFIPSIIFRAALVFLLSMCGAIALAAERQIVISADSAQVNQRTQHIVYSGNVVIKREDFELQAQRVEYTQNDVRRVFKAYGEPVKVFWNSTVTTNLLNNARADYIEYAEGNPRVLDMTGNAYIEVDHDSLESETIHYNFDTELLKAKGGNKRRVRFVIMDQNGN